MRFLKHLLAALSLTLIAGTAGASLASPQLGVDYKALEKSQPAEPGKKVEVIEFFGYFCPHCYALDPILAKWVESQGDKINFKRVHVLFHKTMEPIQHMYVTLEAMGKTEVMHKKIFDAMHRQNQRFTDEASVLAFVSANGIDQKTYLDVYNSFSVQARMRRMPQLLEAYAVTSVPLIVVDGRFMTSPDQMHGSVGNKSEAELAAGMTKVLDFLVDKVAKEHSAKK
jgi:thiol:disulfide interchange protein DsbA